MKYGIGGMDKDSKITASWFQPKSADVYKDIVRYSRLEKVDVWGIPAGEGFKNVLRPCRTGVALNVAQSLAVTAVALGISFGTIF